MHPNFIRKYVDEKFCDISIIDNDKKQEFRFIYGFDNWNELEQQKYKLISNDFEVSIVTIKHIQDIGWEIVKEDIMPKENLIRTFDENAKIIYYKAIQIIGYNEVLWKHYEEWIRRVKKPQLKPKIKTKKSVRLTSYKKLLRDTKSEIVWMLKNNKDFDYYDVDDFVDIIDESVTNLTNKEVISIVNDLELWEEEDYLNLNSYYNFKENIYVNIGMFMIMLGEKMIKEKLYDDLKVVKFKKTKHTSNNTNISIK